MYLIQKKAFMRIFIKALLHICIYYFRVALIYISNLTPKKNERGSDGP